MKTTNFRASVYEFATPYLMQFIRTRRLVLSPHTEGGNKIKFDRIASTVKTNIFQPSVLEIDTRV